ncbi:MAG: hypothetical protein WCI19_01130 [Betaproteobacteria bacterium]|nr:hypothetical protein [Rhodocyclales bacterium]
MGARLLLIAALLLAGCSSAPKTADPPRVKAALEAESDGARRYARGDYAVAARRFDEAARICASIDDAPGVGRNRLHLARAELAQGRAEAALAVLAAAAGDGEGPSPGILLTIAQAQLALGRDVAAQQSLAAASAGCGSACPQLPGLRLLQARAALAAQRAPEALAHAEAALKLLQDMDEAAETGNAWRIIAAARLAAGDTAGALPAAGAALDIDRRLALPEKIARDWLLIGDIRRRAAPGDALRQDSAAAAYRRALDVANAAGLAAIATTATQALADTGGAAEAAR